MVLVVLAYFGGVLTILSPCILPVLPFVFARADKPFLRSGLPLLTGMAATFAAVAALAAVGGGWAVQANAYGRIGAMIVLGLFGLLLVFPALADRATRPLVAAGASLSHAASTGADGASTWAGSLLLGVATGLLWAPCAGPVLGLILTGAALQGASLRTTWLLFSYAAGAATSLSLALLLGRRVFAALKKSLGVGEWIRRGLGAAVLAGVAAIAMGFDTGFLTKLSLSGATSVEQSLVDRLQGRGARSATASSAAAEPPVVGVAPALAGATGWLNSPPLTMAQLRGKVVLIDFWTYSCINCLRSLPYVEAWADKYRAQGLVVIGVHTPEFAFERDPDNVRHAVEQLGVRYPVALDDDYAIWRAFSNAYWPAHYLIDGQGRIRSRVFGEGDYEQSERVIQQLLAENGAQAVPRDVVAGAGAGAGVSAQADRADRQSPETYVGYLRAERFASPGGEVRDQDKTYRQGELSDLNAWSLEGRWTVGPQAARLDARGGRIAFRFHARDLHLVLGPAPDGRPVRFRIRLDGQPPGADHGTDADAQGRGVIDRYRLFQLVRRRGAVRDRTFEIEFEDPGVQAFAFTFG